MPDVETIADVDPLHERIIRRREALALSPDGYPDHASACELLANSLWTSYKREADSTCLDEVIALGRKVLVLRPDGHPDRPMACRKLASYLWPRFEQTGDPALLDETILLEREVLSSHSIKHPLRARFCENLALSLKARYQQQRHTPLLDEAITLEREAIALHPIGQPDHVVSCGRLADMLHLCAEQTGNLVLLDEAIALRREALNSRRNEGRGHSGYCARLASSLRLRHQQTGAVTFIEEATVLEREVVSLHPAGNADHATACSNLGLCLMGHYRQSGRLALLDEAIAMEREALASYPDEHVHRASTCSSLAHYLCALYEKTGGVDLLDEAIALGREALALLPEGHSEYVICLSMLASSLKLRYKHTGGISLLDEAISLERAALSWCPDWSPHHTNICRNHTISLALRYDLMDDPTLLEEAVALCRVVLALHPEGHTDRSTSCGNLALYLATQYTRTGDAALLEEAVSLEREALFLRPIGHTQRRLSCTNLAWCLDLVYQRTGEMVFLDEAIMLEREALTLYPDGHSGHPASCGNLGHSLLFRYQETGHAALLDEAITLMREALSLRLDGHPDRQKACANLAIVLVERYQQTGDVALYDEAIGLSREALALRPPGHPGRENSCGNLAAALMWRYQQTEDPALLDEAIVLERDCLDLRPNGHPYHGLSCSSLAISLECRYRQTKDEALLYEALELTKDSISSSSLSASWRPWTTLCRLCLQPSTPHFSVQAVLEHMRTLSSMQVDNIREFMVAMNDVLGLLWSVHNVWTSDVPSLLAHIYSELIDRQPSLAGYVLEASSQLSALSSVGSMGLDACITAILAGRPAQAMEVLDHAQGVIWAQALHQRDPQLENIPENLASELESLLRAVAVDTGVSSQAIRSSMHLTPLDVRHEQNTRIQAIFCEVRAMPGFERFMLGSTFAQLREAAGEHPAIVLVAARGYTYALILSDSARENPHALPLNVTSARLSSLRETAGRAGLRDAHITSDIQPEDDARLGLYKSSAGSKTNADPFTVLSDLWMHVVKPVLDQLQLQPSTGRKRPRVHWCPTGDFAFLPLHAAGVYDGPYSRQTCCSDYIVSSYTPTLSALLRAQTRAPHLIPSPLSILAIAEDCRAPTSTMQRLWNVAQELTYVEDTAKASVLDCTVEVIARAATVCRVMERIPSANFVHLACHGTQHPTAALESGLYLSDGTLTVAALMSLRLDHAWFVYLSACETAKGDTKQPDQGVHLAAAMLFAGFKSVVATMWSMSDIDGPDMAQWFYEEVLSSETISADSIAYALDHAVQKLREKVPSMPKRWAPYIHMGA